MNKNAFTLIELLSVIVIFAITFLIVVPSMNSLIGSSEKREIELIEERVLSAAKEYVNNFDGSFYKNFYKEGDTSYVYKSDLINAGLIDENEISKLNTFAGVKGELLSNDKIRYTVEYINASNNEYTNEELYLMMQEMRNNYNNLSNEVNNLKNQSGNTTNISLLSVYPVGSIYISENNTNPGTLFGGTWVAYGAGRTLVGVDTSQTEFASVGKTGGSKTHILTVDEMPSHNHNLYLYDDWTANITLTSAVNTVQYGEYTTENVRKGIASFSAGNSQPHNNLQPYITVYMWKRTA